MNFSPLLKPQFRISGMVHTVEKHRLAKRTEFNLKITQTQTTMYLEAPTQVLWTVKKVVTLISMKEIEKWR